ncbi:acyl-CoA N-acyltransferase [Nadsonia fulvescens var. elongata DSM 6958]|uniref:Acyl-CoA N-acyltransferase n=1 Tax=Nadsonia fulvescens var. elongata DSM 6958 TaxID=857566 RepID=A0A1E3PQS0_9ASCO|nr:acyl-CoA N-acyltransferase [Nadsonia fulvescens var. elongata DSM 6958]
MSGKRARIQLDNVNANNLGVLRTINNAVLPLPYAESWYEESLTIGELAKLAYFDEIPVGAARCALKTPTSRTMPTSIYIMTLAVLDPYRGFGIGKRLLKHIIEQAQGMYVHEISVHVWDKNETAIQWYEAQGFEKLNLVNGYYQRMVPVGNAFFMKLSM